MPRVLVRTCDDEYYTNVASLDELICSVGGTQNSEERDVLSAANHPLYELESVVHVRDTKANFLVPMRQELDRVGERVLENLGAEQTERRAVLRELEEDLVWLSALIDDFLKRFRPCKKRPGERFSAVISRFFSSAWCAVMCTGFLMFCLAMLLNCVVQGFAAFARLGDENAIQSQLELSNIWNHANIYNTRRGIEQNEHRLQVLEAKWQMQKKQADDVDVLLRNLTELQRHIDAMEHILDMEEEERQKEEEEQRKKEKQQKEEKNRGRNENEEKGRGKKRKKPEEASATKNMKNNDTRTTPEKNEEHQNTYAATHLRTNQTKVGLIL